ncbi:MAG: anthranilate phosphoribosyltransferase [bacterium]|nr:anthranilate phosphoribosyltransferase [bacterium]
MIRDLLQRAMRGEQLSAEDVALAIGRLMDGEEPPALIAGLLVALAMKGETPEEVIGAARAMRDRALRVEHGLPLVLDVVGTGGDGAHTINISTAAALTVAGAGVPVAKHGNRAASSRCGSADVLEALGVELSLDPDEAARRLRSDRMVFLFAQRFHPAMKNAAPVRRDLGVPTIFNILGPLTNPAGVQRLVLGVAQERLVMLVAEALLGLGCERGAVVHSLDGVDELSGAAPAVVALVGGGRVELTRLDPQELGVRAQLSDLRGGDAPENARALESILSGERSPRADVVALNAALALQVAGLVEELREGLALARQSIAQGAALATLQAMRAPHRSMHARSATDAREEMSGKMRGEPSGDRAP